MELQHIRDESHFELILALEEAVIYKHGPLCWASMVAHRHVKKFSVRHPEVPVFFVDVVAQRPLSRRIEEILGIRHESPQAIIMFNGHPVWNASHYRVTSNSIERGLALERKELSQVSP